MACPQSREYRTKRSLGRGPRGRLRQRRSGASRRLRISHRPIQARRPISSCEWFERHTEWNAISKRATRQMASRLTDARVQVGALLLRSFVNDNKVFAVGV